MSWSERFNQEGGGEYLKIESGQRVELILLAPEPGEKREKVFLGGSAEDFDPAKHTGLDVKVTWPWPVYVLGLGQKIWDIGPGIGKRLGAIEKRRGALTGVVYAVEKEGSGLKTKWTVTDIRAATQEELVAATSVGHDEASPF